MPPAPLASECFHMHVNPIAHLIPGGWFPYEKVGDARR